MLVLCHKQPPRHHWLPPWGQLQAKPLQPRIHSHVSQTRTPPRFQSITADITDNFPSLEHNFKRIAVKIIMLLQSIHYQSNVYTFLLCISLSVCTSWVFVLSSLCMYMYIYNLNFLFSNSVHISGQQQITSDSHCTCLADAKVLYVR